MPGSAEPGDQGGVSRDGVVWTGPGLRVERAQSWGGVSAAIYQRGGGESTWRNPRHRLVLALTALGGVSTRVEGGHRLDIIAPAGTLGFHPGGATLEIAHGSGRVIQVLQDPALYDAVAAEACGRCVLGIEPILPFEDPLIAQIVRTLAAEMDGGPASRLLVDGLSTVLAVQVVRRFVRLQPPRADRGMSRERLRRVLDYVEAHLDEELTLAELADVACLSPWHFSRRFKQAMGVGPQRYTAQRRVERAKALMRRSDQTLAGIAASVGFADQSHFTEVFRRETGTTPGRFRAAVA
jgi:AraC family transcriptional regulator